MHRIFGLLCLGYAFSAAASSPGIVAGPPGCSWDATVIGGGMISSATDETFFFVKLEKEYGRCMAFVPAETCGTSGKEFRLAVPGYAPEKYKAGATVRVWVNGATARVENPACTQTPIKR